MAKSPKQPEAKVTRIKASETKPAKKETKQAKANAKLEAKTRKKSAWLKPFLAIGRYFKGAWIELKQVRWPTRKATWGLTMAVILYSAFFVALVVLLDTGFSNLLELILG